MSEPRAGVLLRIDGALHFVAASEAVSIEQMPRVDPVPGSPSEVAGIASYGGEIIPVILLGAAPSRVMVVVRHETELVGLAGAEIVATGIFPEEDAPALDIASLHARLQGAAWAGRWGV